MGNIISGAAAEFLKERYVPFRAEQGRRLHFETADYRALHSPYDQTLIAMVGYMNEKQAFENLDTLNRVYENRKYLKTHERIECLKKAAGRIRERHEAFSDLIALEGGKPLKDARVEVTRAINSLEYAAEEAGRIHGREIPMRGTKSASGRVAFTYPEPIGVVLAISAFNHPLNLIVHQVAPAIAVGCPVLVKPALETPLSCLHFLDMLYEAGLPPEMCLPLIADNQVVEKIVRSQKIKFMTFIGSAKVGWHLKSILAPGTRVALEHGGAAPVIIDEKADLDQALPILLKGAYYHSGQVCVSTQRVFVHASLEKEFEERFLKAVKELKIGDPRQDTVDCGPIIRKRDIERINQWIDEAKKSGAQVLIGGASEGKSFYQPTVIRGAAKEDRVMKEEIFGPVVCFESYRDLDEAIQKANGVDWSFQAAVFTQDIERALYVARSLRASAVMINDGTAFRVDWMPFRGDGPSGFGTGGIPYTMHDMVTEKMIVMKSPSFEM